MGRFMNLYLTADRVGTATGGGKVVSHESAALKAGFPDDDLVILDGARIAGPPDPYEIDAKAKEILMKELAGRVPRLACFYAGCFTETVAYLRSLGTKIAYTAAAHDRTVSMDEFGRLGFEYPHRNISDETLWQKYLGGYRGADLVTCPSSMSARLMGEYGCRNVTVVPHGVEIPDQVKPPPERFVVGSLGQLSGPDKGLRYLVTAWRKLCYKDAVLKLAGPNPEGVLDLVRRFGGGNIQIMGFVDSVTDFFNSCTVYSQPSVSEGFGIEVLEAMAHQRPVVAAEGAGAAEIVSRYGCGAVVPIRDPDALAEKIDRFKQDPQEAIGRGIAGREVVRDFTWDKVRARYIEVWKKLLA